MQKDMLQSIDDSALETVSGGHHGHLIEVIQAVRSDIREHVVDAVKFGAHVAGSAVEHAGERLEAIGKALQGGE